LEWNKYKWRADTELDTAGKLHEEPAVLVADASCSATAVAVQPSVVEIDGVLPHL
jgi:hypothetical protein